MRVPVADVAASWTGKAFVVWQEFETIPPVLRFGARSGAVSWLQGALAELGYFTGEQTGTFDHSTRDGVRALQQAHHLLPDGAAGPHTQMLLYDLLEDYPVPRLVETGGPG